MYWIGIRDNTQEKWVQQKGLKQKDIPDEESGLSLSEQIKSSVSYQMKAHKRDFKRRGTQICFNGANSSIHKAYEHIWDVISLLHNQTQYPIM